MGSRPKSRSTVEVAEFYPFQGQWTEEDYLALPDSNRYAELSEGRLVVPPHPTLLSGFQVAVNEVLGLPRP